MDFGKQARFTNDLMTNSQNTYDTLMTKFYNHFLVVLRHGWYYCKQVY